MTQVKPFWLLQANDLPYFCAEINSMAKKAYSAKKVFTGDSWLNDKAVITENARIKEIISINDVDPGTEHIKLDGILAPAYIDLQIYGAHGRLLAMYPDTQSLHELNAYCRDGGAAWCMATVATNTYEIFHDSINAVRKYWDEGGEGILGVHLEGPWINTVKKGAHIESLIHSPTMQQVKDLLDFGKGVIKMITLAPEVCSPEVIEYILANNIVISAGHSNAGFEEAVVGFDRGIRAVTHLYNAMSPLQHRAPGLVGAAMLDERAMASIIPDGYHVDFAAIKIAKEVMKDRLFVITDAVTDTEIGGYKHKLAGDKYEADGILSGSALTMGKSVKNLVEKVGLSAEESIRMCSTYPAKVIGMQNELGKIASGYQNKMVLLSEDLDVLQLID